jgi:hypothetical protein
MDGNNTQIRIVVKKDNGAVECLALVPSLKDFWLRLAEDEQRHSDWLGSQTP